MNIHTVMARTVLTVFPVVLVLGVIALVRHNRGYVVPHGTDIADVVAGKWAWTTADDPCGADWHTISFSAAGDSMWIVSSRAFEGVDGGRDSITDYVIQELRRSRIRASIPGETRLTATGTPVVWDLVLRGPDRYAWHRTDWFPGTFTAEIVRCEPGAARP